MILCVTVSDLIIIISKQNLVKQKKKTSEAVEYQYHSITKGKKVGKRCDACWGQKQSVTHNTNMFGMQGHHWGPFIHLHIMITLNGNYQDMCPMNKSF